MLNFCKNCRMDEHVSILSEDELRSLGADIRLELENGFNAVEIAYNTKLKKYYEWANDLSERTR